LSEGASTEVYAPFVETNGFNEANITYLLNVTVDPENKITEGNETNNSMEARVGPDLVVSNIKVSPSDDCNSTIIATIENKGILNATNFFVKLNISGEGEREVPVEILEPNKVYNVTVILEPNKVYNVTVIADSENTVEELNEGNNVSEIEIGPDIDVWYIKPPRYLLVEHPSNIEVGIRNIGTVGAKEFDVTLYPKGANVSALRNETLHIDCLPPGRSQILIFEWKPPKEDWYNFTVRADAKNVEELNKGNNERRTSSPVKAFAHLGYEGDELKPYTSGEVRGGIYFKIGDRIAKNRDPKHWYDVYRGDNNSFVYGSGSSYIARWNITIPNLKKINVSRLYLYWGGSWAKDINGSVIPMPPKIDMKFNGVKVPLSKEYLDYPVDEKESYGGNYAYGTYCYDVHVNNGGNNYAEFTISGVNETWIAGMGLLIVYEGGNETLTKYWIDEGADVLLSGATSRDYYTPLSPNETTTKVPFNGCVDPYKLGNATLVTVVPFGNDGNVANDFKYLWGGKWGNKKKNGLYFDSNRDGKFNDFDEEIEDGAWKCDPSRDSVGINEKEVKNLGGLGCNNLFGIQDRGDFMISANAFLILTYPPDLEPEVSTRLNANAGASYNIPITIHNWGRSKAKNFTVIVTIDGTEVKNETINELEEGANMTINIPEKAPAVEGIVTLEVNVSVDPENRVNELIERNNIWNGTVMVVVREPEIGPPTGGRGGGSGKGIGTGSEAGTQGGAFGGMSAGAGREGASKGEKKAGNESVRTEEAKKTLWGYLMNNIVMPGEEKAGGSSGFSLWEYLIKVFAFIIGIAFLVLGYLFERRRHNAAKHVRKERKSRGESER